MPRYSFVTWSMNDQHGAFDERGPTPQQRLRLGVESMLGLGDVEVIVVDPGANDFDLPGQVKILKVRPEQLPQGKINAPFLWNYGIRRAQGEYILSCTADDFFIDGFLDVVDSVASKDALLVCSKHYATTLRIFGGHTYWVGALDYATLHPALAFGAFPYPHDSFLSKVAETGHDLHVLHRDAWHACRGFDERLVDWGFVDIQLCLRLQNAGYEVINLAGYGARMFHLDHKPQVPTRFNSWVDTDKFVTNAANWGGV